MYVRTSSLLHSAKGNCVVTNLLHTCCKLTTTSTFRILPKCITRVNLLTRLSHITEIDHDVLKLRLAFTSSCVGIHNCKSPPLDYSHLYILPSKLSQLKMHSNILRRAIQCHWLNEMSRSHWKDVNILENDPCYLCTKYAKHKVWLKLLVWHQLCEVCWSFDASKTSGNMFYRIWRCRQNIYAVI